MFGLFFTIHLKFFPDVPICKLPDSKYDINMTWQGVIYSRGATCGTVVNCRTAPRITARRSTA